MVKPRKAFTLVELLVVIAVIGILVGILLPAVNAVRAKARQAQCVNNIRNVGLATLNYESQQFKLPIGVQLAGKVDGKGYTGIPLSTQTDYCGTTVFSLLLANVEERKAYENYDFRVSYREEVNWESVGSRVAIYQCPADTSRDRALKYYGYDGLYLSRSNYVACFGSGKLMFGDPNASTPNRALADTNGIFRADGSRRIEAIKDGKSKTVMFSEVISGKKDTGHVLALDFRGVWAAEFAGASSYTHLFGPNSMPDPEAEVPWEEGQPYDYKGDRIQPFPNANMCEDSIIAPCAERGDGGSPGYFNDYASARSRHSGGVNVVFADNHTAYVSEDIDLDVWRAAGTYDNAKREPSVNIGN